VQTPPDASGWLVCAQSRAALAGVEPVLRDAIATRDPRLRALALHLIGLGGKRLRPALVILAGRFGAAAEERLLRAAAAVELLHVASLYHDDVIDRAPTRRGAASANARFGNGSATVGGTYLFSCATALLAGLGEGVSRLASEASAEVCIGELQEIENAYNLELQVDEHLEIVARKTATLFELPCRLGALLGELEDSAAQSLARYGRELGVAFQLADDALDLTGNSATMGKGTRIDLRQGVYSLPVLEVLGQSNGDGRRLAGILARLDLSPAEADEAAGLVRTAGAVDAALAVARAHAATARAALDELDPIPARMSLAGLVDYALARDS
jgi:heptaprenyl diphosphate synthase